MGACVPAAVPSRYQSDVQLHVSTYVSTILTCMHARRRITNRDSARRMRLLRQEELTSVREEVQQLVDDNQQLAAQLQGAEAASASSAQESASWQQLWHAAMSANLRLSDRLSAFEQAAAEVRWHPCLTCAW